MKITDKAQVRIPQESRQRPGILRQRHAEPAYRPDNLLLVKAEARKGVKIRHGVPLARNDGVPMTAEEVAATLGDG
jgi:hypothetical protein